MLLLKMESVLSPVCVLAAQIIVVGEEHALDLVWPGAKLHFKGVMTDNQAMTAGPAVAVEFFFQYKEQKEVNNIENIPKFHYVEIYNF